MGSLDLPLRYGAGSRKPLLLVEKMVCMGAGPIFGEVGSFQGLVGVHLLVSPLRMIGKQVGSSEDSPEIRDTSDTSHVDDVVRMHRRFARQTREFQRTECSIREDNAERVAFHYGYVEPCNGGYEEGGEVGIPHWSNQ